MKFARLGIFAVTCAVVLTAGAAAQAQDLPQRKEVRRVDLSGAPGMEVVSSVSTFQPGDEFPRHLHHGVELGYVVQGTMVQLPGQAPTMMATGAPIMNLRDAVHVLEASRIKQWNRINDLVGLAVRGWQIIHAA